MPSRLTRFHEGEAALHRMLKVPPLENPTASGLPGRYGMRVTQSPLVALGTLDEDGRPWTTVLGGEREFARPIAENVVGMSSIVPGKWDPVFEAFWEECQSQQVVRRERGMSALAIDLETRDRVKLAGRMVAAAITGEEESRVRMAMLVTESLGNCPKYLNKKVITPHGVEGAELRGEGLPLCREAIRLLGSADLFFLSSTNGESMDTNHRGGSPGFVRVLRNEEDGVVLVYPEYSGNRLYQTLGNLNVNPLVGIVVPDFETGDALYATGSATILVGEDASSIIARTNLAVQITVTDARYVKSGLAFRGSVIDYSPYNPPIRHLLAEQAPHVSSLFSSPSLTATLVDRKPLTPTISRFTFRLSADARFSPGQHITFDFAPELSGGYAHMRDDDPQSLNDDYVRTFTVSNTPEDARHVEITARRQGPATRLLWGHSLWSPLDVPVMGFGGEEAFRMSRGEQSVFVAGGVGITPLLAQAGGLLDGDDQAGRLEVLWSLRWEDMPLAVDSFERIGGLAKVTTLFMTGSGAGDGGASGRAKDLGAGIIARRIAVGDVGRLKGRGSKFYLCALPELLKKLCEWLDGEDVVWEDFGY